VVSGHEHHAGEPLAKPPERLARGVQIDQRKQITGYHDRVAGDRHVANELGSAVSVKLQVKVGDQLDAHEDGLNA
jgi:hypothetical protein